MAPHRGHIHDSERSSSPPYISEPLPIQAEKWRRWVSSPPPSADDSTHSIISNPSRFESLFGAYKETYDHEASVKRHLSRKHGEGYHPQTLPHRVWEIFINDPWVPGVIRIIMFALSIVTLGLGGRLTYLNTHLSASIIHNNGDLPICRVSPIMAVVLATLAIFYLPYIFYDEYFGGPVGIRSPLSKARLLFFDLLFVVLYSVNVTIAADEAFIDACTSDFRIERAVFATVLVTIVAWIGTFSITLIRLIARIGAAISSARGRGI